MTTKLKMTGIRLTDEQTYKMKYIADAHHRKMNDEYRLIVDKHIEEYEKEHGEIKIENTKYDT